MHISHTDMTGVTTVSVGFWASAPMAYSTAAARHSSTPVVLAVSTADSSRVLSEMSATPDAATAMPISRGLGKPSLSRRPANSAMRMGPTVTTRAAVPASTCCSPALRATLYARAHARQPR